MAGSITARRDDRLDLIASRAYPDTPTSEAIREMVWANLDLPPLISEGTTVNTPDPTPVQYGRAFTRLPDLVMAGS